MKKLTWALTILGSALASATTACSAGGGSGPQEDLVVAKGSALHQADSCDDLLAQIHADATAKLDDVVAQYKANPRGYYYGGDGDVGSAEGDPVSGGVSDDGASNSTGSSGDGDGLDLGGTSTGSDGAPEAPSKGDQGNDNGMGPSDGESGSDDPQSHSETNTQVEDVDEADIVKIEEGGKRIFLVHGSEFKIVDAWPAADLSQAGVAQVPGSPYELFVHGGKATVFSSVNPSDLPDDGSNDTSGDSKGGCWYGGSNYTQISIFDVSGDAPVLEREMIFEGDYVSSRRHDGVVRAVVRGGFSGRDTFYPDLDYYDSFGREKSKERLASDLDDWRDEVAGDIATTVLSDWLPNRYEKVDGNWEPIAMQCDSYFIPEPGSVEAGVTQVVSIEPDKATAPQVTAILGGSDIVYANEEALYLSQADYRWDRFATGSGPRSLVHKFEIKAARSNYLASGYVPGIPLNQFSLDEREGVLRVATTDNDWSTFPKNQVYTMKNEGTELKVLDRSELLGEEGETIFGVRFIEERGYVVTFEQTDPLYALDLSDPTDIKVLGELHIPGFSSYLHPLGDHHLLTIGQDADENGSQDGVALQIFDVSDAVAPKLESKYNFGGFSSSEAGYNHKAFTYVKDYFDGEDDLLLFPLVTYAPEYRSGLEVLRVSETDGFSYMGRIDHAALINRGCAEFTEYGYPCYYYYGEEMRRGLQIDDFIYALSQGGMTVHDVGKLADGPIATLEFDRPTFDQQNSCYYGYGDYVGGGTSASVGMPEPDEMTEADTEFNSNTSGSDTTTSSTGAAMGGSASD